MVNNSLPAKSGGWLARVGVVAVGSKEKDILSKIFLGLISSLPDQMGSIYVLA